MCANFSRETGKIKPLGRTKCRWHGNIKIHFKEISYEGMGGIKLAQYRVENDMCIN
jgi:hypothetical protein